MKVNHSLKRLFISETRLKLLKTFYNSPKELFYVRQLVRLCHEEINSVRRELSNLKDAGILTSENRGNRLYYYLNPDNPLYLDLLVMSHQADGLGQAIAESKSVGQVRAMLYSQHFVSGSEYSPDHIDMILIGEIVIREVELLVKEAEKNIGREINYMVMDKSEFKIRKQKRDPILVDFFLNCPLVIIGQPNSLAEHV
jgi:hypothetical protein